MLKALELPQFRKAVESITLGPLGSCLRSFSHISKPKMDSIVAQGECDDFFPNRHS